MFFSFVFNIDDDVIEVYYYKNVKLLRYNLVDIVLERDWCIAQFKKHYLVFKMTITGLKGRLLFVFFL